MQIHGINKLTLLDFPERLACLVFTGSCNYRCPFCHNASLVVNPNSQPLIPEEEIFSFLKSRTGVLEGICISGGEPTLQADLEDFIKKVRELGFLVKLDTNGSRPEVVESLLSQGLLDYVAMDIKNSPAKYTVTCGLRYDVNNPLSVTGSDNSADNLVTAVVQKTNDNLVTAAVQETEDNLVTAAVRKTADLLMHSGIRYEFRSTLIREFHTEADLLAIGSWLRGADRYFLQSFRDSDTLVGAAEGQFHSFTKEEMHHFQSILEPFFHYVGLRGID